MNNHSTKDSIRGWFAIIIILLLIWGTYKICNYKSKSVDTTIAKQITLPQTEEELRAAAKALLEKKQRDSIVNEQYQKEARIAKRKWESSKAGRIQKKHPEWTNEECERIANNNIWIGMHIEMIVYLRGRPNSANPSDYGNGREWQWCWHDYTPSCFYGNDDGIVRAYN